MDFVTVMEQAIALLRQRGRVTYRTLQLQFTLNDEQLAALKDELLYSQPQVRDHPGRGLLWTEDAGPVLAGTAAPVESPAQAPLTYTPPYLAEKILTSRSALEGERKQVTVLFADLKGSMELLADRDPEEARQLLDPVLERMMAAVHRYEGTVNQVMGDGIMALFGAPLAHEDHAVRACYAALAMQDAIRRYSGEVRRTHGVEVQIRVGLNSGEVVVRAIGNDLHMDYSAIGETTHLAARIEQLVTPGSIRLTAATLRLAEGLVQVNALGPVPVRGLTEPVEVFELVVASTTRGRLQASAARGLTCFVGRQQELTVLQQALEQAGLGHGQVVAIVGEAGVGKSRLVYEFIHSHHTPGWSVLESASVSYGKATPYFPVIDLLRRYGHIEEQDDTRTVRAKLTGQVLTLDETLQDTLPALLSLLDALLEDSPFLRLDPPQRRQRTLDALKRVFLRESQVQPLLLVFEDLHWIDSETQALVESLVESLPTSRLLLMVNYRPEYQHGWGSKTYYTQLRLDPLPPMRADEFLQALLGDDASLAPLKPLLIARTEGNPFFLEESVRTLVETGGLVGEPGTYRLAHALPTVQVPATVQAVLAARIDRLPPEEKRLLQTAAVIGTEVPFALLRAIADVSEEALHRSLAHHALRGEVWDKAVTYCQQASGRAYDHAAFREAVASFDQALQALAHRPKDGDTGGLSIDLRLALEGALTALGEYGRRLALLGEAEALARALDDRARLGRVLAGMGNVLRLTGDPDSAMAAGQQALELAVELGERVLQMEASLYLGQTYYDIGDFGRAAERLRWNVDAADREAGWPSADMLIQSQVWLARTLSALGAFAEGRRHGEEALRLATLAGRGATPVTAHAYLGELSLTQGDLEHAIGVFDKGLAICRASGYQGGALRVIVAGLGSASALQGRLAEGRALLEEGISEGIRMGGLRGLAYRVAWLSEVCRLAGRGEEAWQHARQALDLARQHKERGNEARALYQLGVVQEHADPPDAAQTEAHYQQALALAEALSMRPLQAHCHRGLGMLYAATDQRDKARPALSTAIEMYRDMAMSFWLPETEAALAQVEKR